MVNRHIYVKENMTTEIVVMKMKKRVFLDGKHIAVININEAQRTVFAEIETKEGSDFVYAEKFDDVCNYEKEAIKACIRYLKNMSVESVTVNSFMNLFALIMILINLDL